MAPNLIPTIEDLLSKMAGTVCHVQGVSPISGGCINDAKRLKTNIGDFFIKVNSAQKFPNMFQAEARGLNILREANEMYVPKVIGQAVADGQQFLLTEFVDSVRKTNDFWEDFGYSLARLHKHSCNNFGLNHDNYIGSLAQSNKENETWHGFFIESRLKPQLKLAADKGLLSHKHHKHFEGLFAELPNIFPNEPPALLHGDLWSGNFMVSAEGKACIIDPAVYYGHREMDIAITQLFGGFEPSFYHAYQEEFPMEKGWQQRLDIYNLYPLLVHVNLFGKGYVSQVQNIVARF